MLPTVALVGRPNVGKSTLFNRLAGRRLALVSKTPGLTRDRREAEVAWGDLAFRLIDTAGMEEAEEGSLAGRMRAQTDLAIARADLTLFLIDARAGLTPLDKSFADALRRGGRPVVVVANKCEGRAGASGIYDAYELGLGEPVAISAEHGEAIGDLMSVIAEGLAEAAAGGAAAGGVARAGDAADRPLQLVVIGRPNAGKSTLVNRLLGEARMLTGAEPGITRDAIAVDWRWRDRAIRLFDTAGLRRQARVADPSETLAREDAKRAIRFAEVVVLLLDARQPLERQDLHLASQVADEGRALVVAANKGDLVQDRRGFLVGLRQAVDANLAQLAGAPVVLLSALEGWGTDALMTAVVEVHATWNRRITTGALNRWLAGAVERHPPPAPGGRRIRLRYLTQANARPPTFVVFASRPEAVPESYRRYIVNALREEFDLPGVPIRLHLRKGKNPYAPRSPGAAKR
jgi:GTP-binding protein